MIDPVDPSLLDQLSRAANLEGAACRGSPIFTSLKPRDIEQAQRICLVNH
jgi:hypothetical protein